MRQKISFRSKTKRLTGRWELVEVYSGNTKQRDVPDFYYDFDEDGTVTRYSEGIRDGDGTWKFESDKEALRIEKNWNTFYTWTDGDGDSGSYSDNAYGCASESWHIYRLTSKELSVLSLQGGMDFKMNFIKEE